MPEELSVTDVSAVIAELEVEFDEICELGDTPVDSKMSTASRFQCC